MSVFKLRSNKQFIRTLKESSDIQVLEYVGDPRDFTMVDLDARSWGPPAIIGPSAEATSFKALEVFGVTIGGDQLKELVEDLKVSCSKGDKALCVAVNRQGLCFVGVNTVKGLRAMRINDHFGWSKYGVVLEIGSGDVWSIFDMSNGHVLLGPPTTTDQNSRSSKDDNVESSSVWKKVLEEKEKVMEKTESLLRKSIEEKENETISIRAALKALTSATTSTLAS